MDKILLKEMFKNQIVAVIRIENKELAKEISTTIFQKGIDIIEITYTVENARLLIHELKKSLPDSIVGAGTVLDLSQAKEAIEQGADFIVTPCLIEEVATYCKENNIFFSMGASTPTEIYNAYQMGADIIKLFPGEFLKPAFIKSLKGPFPFVEFMPTGGVDNSNIAEWFRNGAYAVGVGGYLTRGINLNNLYLLEERIEKLIEAVKIFK